MIKKVDSRVVRSTPAVAPRNIRSKDRFGVPMQFVAKRRTSEPFDRRRFAGEIPAGVYFDVLA